MKKVAISQSNYIPWKGYFDLIASVNIFVFYDDVQFTKRDWRSRNLIKTRGGIKWLTIPVLSKGRYLQKINETEIDGLSWARSHWQSISQNYKKSKFYLEVAQWHEPLYLDCDTTSLSDFNINLVKRICDYLDIKTELRHSREFNLVDGKNERLIQICKQIGASEYVSGPAAIEYIDESLFLSQGINVSWVDYGGYLEYEQLWGGFEHHLSIIDLLFNCGPNASKYMKYVKK